MIGSGIDKLNLSSVHGACSKCGRQSKDYMMNSQVHPTTMNRNDLNFSYPTFHNQSGNFMSPRSGSYRGGLNNDSSIGLRMTNLNLNNTATSVNSLCLCGPLSELSLTSRGARDIQEGLSMLRVDNDETETTNDTNNPSHLLDSDVVKSLDGLIVCDDAFTKYRVP